MTFNPNYVTSLPWGLHPAGTPCVATRLDIWTLKFEFQDSTELIVKGHYWLKGLEDHDKIAIQRETAYEQAILNIMVQTAAQEAQAEEDARVFDILDKASQALADEAQNEIDIQRGN